MAEVIAFMNSTSKSFVAFNQAHMCSTWISITFLDWAANFFALVSLATLVLIANFCACEALLLFLLLC